MIENVLYVAKNELDGMTEEEVIRAFESTDDLEEIKSLVKNAKDRIYLSWASVDVKDKAGERIPFEELKKEQDVLLRRGGPITDEHSNAIVGKTLAYKILEHPEAKAMGVLHLNKIFNDGPLDDRVWKEIVSGKRKGSSVGGYKEREEYEYDDKGATKILRGFHQYETATVHNPVNPFALNEAYSVVAKSANSLEPVSKPFAGYNDFADCVAQNHDKEDPEAYCGAIKYQVEKVNGTMSERKIVEDVNKAPPGMRALKPGEKPPKGAVVVTGPKGGKYVKIGDENQKQQNEKERMSEEFMNWLEDYGKKPELSREDKEKINQIRDLINREKKSDHLKKGVNTLADVLAEKLGLPKDEKFEEAVTSAVGIAFPEIAENALISEKKESVLNKKNAVNKKSEGELTMDEEVRKAFDDLNARIDKLMKQAEEEEKPSEEAPVDEASEEEEKKPEEEVEKKVDESGKDIPEDQRPAEENNDDVFKKLQAIEKKLATVEKSLTPRQATLKKNEVKKSSGSNVAVDIALGKVKKSWAEVHELAKTN